MPIDPTLLVPVDAAPAVASAPRVSRINPALLVPEQPAVAPPHQDSVLDDIKGYLTGKVDIGGKIPDVSKDPSTAVKVLAGLGKVAQGTVSAPSLALMGATGGASAIAPVLGRAAAAILTPLMVRQAAQDLGRGSVEAQQGDTQKATEDIGGATVTGLFAGAGARDLLGPRAITQPKIDDFLKNSTKPIENVPRGTTPKDSNETRTAPAQGEAQKTPQTSPAAPPAAQTPPVRDVGARAANAPQQTQVADGLRDVVTKAKARLERNATAKTQFEGLLGAAHDSPEGQQRIADVLSGKVDEPGERKILLGSRAAKSWKPPGGAPPAPPDSSAAKPDEAAEPPKATSIKNAAVDEERAARGLPPVVEPIRKAFGKSWDAAIAKMESNPDAGAELVDELKRKPRALTDEEDALLLHRQVTLQNEHQKSAQALIDATESGKPEAVAEHNAKLAVLSDKLLDLYNAGKTAGTETGRGLAARRMMAREDYSLAQMEVSKRAANRGEPLTESQRGELQGLHDRIAELQKRYDDYVANSGNRESTQASEQAHEEIVRTANSRSDPAEKIKANIKERMAKGDKADISTQIQLLARHFVRQGIVDREALIDAVHESIQDVAPMSRRETMDAISGYGSFKQLSKDDIAIQLRGMKGEMQQLAKLEDMAANKPPLKTGVERRTPTDEERRLIAAVNEAKFKFQIPVEDPGTQLKSALDTVKTTLKNRITDYEDRVARGDYSKKPRRELQLDEAAIKLKADADRAKLEFQRGLAKDRLRQRTAFEKTQDTLAKWRRGFLLSGPVTLAKLTSAAGERIFISPMEEAVGAGIGKVIPDIARGAPRQGGLNTRAESKAITDGFTKGMNDAWQTLRTGHSDLDVLYGKQDVMPRSAIDFLGSIHGALKAPAKRAEFARSFEKRTQNALDNGSDPTDPMVQMKIALASYKDANASIFMQNNIVVDSYKAALARAGKVDKATGKPTSSGKGLVTSANVLLPIVRVPANIVAETLQYSFGSVTGLWKAASALAKGVDTLTPEAKDQIMQSLKKGSLGAALLFYGFLHPDAIGGYYQEGEKRKPGDVQAGGVKIFGHEVPRYLVHNPLLEQLQIGATVKRVMESKFKKSDVEQKGLGWGVFASAMGLAEAVPFAQESVQLAKLANPRESRSALGSLTRSMVVPQAVQSLAQHMDTDAQGNPIKRRPQTVSENIETGIPGLRQNVPVDTRK